ncbi:hypothetical protein V2J09_017345 [Rumex salicifolius]
MSQIVSKKKGRPSKADLAARAAAAESNNGHINHNRRPTAEEEEEERDIRRSLRRRSGVRYNLLDYDDEDYLDDDDEFDFEEDKMEAEDDGGGGGGRREKKLKFVLKLRNSSDSGRAARSNGGGSGDSVVRSRRAGCRGSESEEEEEEDEEERFVKKRKISDGENEVDDDFGNNDDDEEREGKRDYHKRDFVYGGMNDPLSRTPMPEKKQLELILDKLQKKDTYGVYADPVDPDELPDYHDIIKNPMDFSTVRKKLANGSYSFFEQFESDIYLICSNAMKYNKSDTVYHKQARAIKELAQRKFHRVRSYIKQTRIENEGNKKEASSEQKAKPMPIVKKQMRNPLGHSTQDRTQDPVSSDFSYGATLATTDAHNPSNGVQTSAYERPSNCEGLVEGMSSLHVESIEKVEDIQSGKGMTKFGRKPLVVDENHRGTYEISNQPVDRSESIFATFEGEDKQLIPVGLYEEHSYAQSLAHYAATLGPVAWRTASKRIEQALPQGSKFGRGWVVEYEPIPTPVLYVADQFPNEHASAKKPQYPAASVRNHKPSETLNSSSEQVGVSGPLLNGKPSFFPGAGGRRPTTPSGSVAQQQNPFVRKLQNAANLSENSSPADDRGPKRPISDSKPPQMPSMGGSRPATPTGATFQQHNPFGKRLQNACIPAKINKSSDSVVTTSGCPENGSISEGKSSILPTFRGSRPTTPTGPVMQPHNPFSRTNMRPESPSFNRMDANAPNQTNQKTNPFVQRQFSGSAETTWLEVNPARNNNFLQPIPVRPQLQASEGVIPGRFPNGNVNRCVDINQMATSPSSGAPAQGNGTKMSFPPRQEQVLSDPLQAMRLSVENAQKQQNQMHNLLGPMQIRPSIHSLRGDNTSGATAASVPWMHTSPADLNRPNQIPASSVYNKTQELYPHILQSSECPVPGLRYFQPERSKASSFEEHVSNHAKASNESQVQNRSNVFPQLLQSPRHGLSPHIEQKKEQKRKRDTLPPDLNVAFQSTVDPQQPDLALQLVKWVYD